MYEKKLVLFLVLVFSFGIANVYSKEEQNKDLDFISIYLDPTAYYFTVNSPKVIDCGYKALKRAEKIKDDRFIGIAYSQLAALYYNIYSIYNKNC